MTGTVGELELKGGVRVLVDSDVLQWARNFRWYRKNGYVCRYLRLGRRQYVEEYLHRLIMNSPEGLDVHHVDEDPLNNRRSNLAVVDRVEHRGRHRRSHSRARFTQAARQGSSSGLKGVSRHPRSGKWQAMIKAEGKNLFLGSYQDPEEAALVYDAAVLHYRGGQGYMNFIAAGDR